MQPPLSVRPNQELAHTGGGLILLPIFQSFCFGPISGTPPYLPPQPGQLELLVGPLSVPIMTGKSISGSTRNCFPAKPFFFFPCSHSATSCIRIFDSVPISRRSKFHQTRRKESTSSCVLLQHWHPSSWASVRLWSPDPQITNCYSLPHRVQLLPASCLAC